jgi:thiopeptide-type bacteriocin biosynthesis protein
VDLPNYCPSGFFALRTPLLPFDELLAWGKGLDAPGRAADGLGPAAQAPPGFEEAVAANRERLHERLRAVVTTPEFREALFLASPGLDERVEAWLREPEVEAGGKIERALARYFQRMASRPTPFGLFAGCSVGTIGPRTELRLGGRAGYRRHARLDMDYVVGLTTALSRDAGLRDALTYRPNSSLYGIDGRLRYTEVRRGDKGWSHHRVGVAASDYLAETLARAAAGARPGELAAALVEGDPDASPADAREFVQELIDDQLLVSELAPAVTGPEPVDGLVSRLRELAPAVAAAGRLEQAQEALRGLCELGPGADRDRYRAIARSLEGLPAKLDPARLFQVDMVKPADDATLGPAVVGEILRGAAVLLSLARPSDDGLAKFRLAFRERYHADGAAEHEARWVPLVEVLDDEAGVGFEAAGGPGAEASALLEGLSFPEPAEKSVPWGRREDLLLRKLTEALARGDPEIVLGADDLEKLAPSGPPSMPDAFAALATLAASSATAADRGDFRLVLHGVFGPSGANLLGRFCHADPELRGHVRDHLRIEESLQPDAIFAEIVHLPEGRVGNILARPVLREYEIPYLGMPAVPPDRQIPVTDLLVSVVGDRVVLRSARLGRRVIPRLTCAHNFAAGQGIYKFLCLLQAQGTRHLAFDWGPLATAAFLPRVVSGRVVLARARWAVGRGEVQALADAGGAGERFRTARAWRDRRRLPRFVLLAEGDNELPVDLDNVLSVETFLELAKAQERVRLVEMFPGPDELCARGPEGRFTHELVVPFVRCADLRAPGAGTPRANDANHRPDNPLPERATAPPTASGGPGPPTPARIVPHPVSRHEDRRFPPGSEWLYAKLYCGTTTADQVLCDVVRPVTEAALGSGAADRWFFIRYADPEGHLRLRLHGDPERLQGDVLPALRAAAAPFLASGSVWRFQLDTYEREVERYGGPQGIELAERLFQADSEAVLAIVAQYPEDPRADARWRLTLRGLDRLLTDLGLDLDGKLAVLRRARDGFAAEFRADARLRRELGDRYRRARADLLDLTGESHPVPAPLAPGVAALRRRSERTAAVTAELIAQERAGRLSSPVAALAPSFLHMHANRMLRSAQRMHEVVLYDLLYRCYESRASRQRASRAVSPEAPGPLIPETPLRNSGH